MWARRNCRKCAASIWLGGLQESLFDQGSSRVEVTYYSNVLCLGVYTSYFAYTGELQQATAYTFGDSHALSVLTVYTVIAYIAISFHMRLVNEFGSIAAVLVGNSRKALSIVVSFVMFPKPTSPLYVVGGVLVFGSLVGISVVKETMRSKARVADSGKGSGKDNGKSASAADGSIRSEIR